MQEKLDSDFLERVHEWMKEFYLLKEIDARTIESRRLRNQTLIAMGVIYLIGLSFLHFMIAKATVAPLFLIGMLLGIVYSRFLRRLKTIFAIEPSQQELQKAEQNTKHMLNSLPILVHEEVQALKRLINVTSISEEAIATELQAIKEYPNLSQWIFLQKLCSEFQVDQNNLKMIGGGKR